MSTAPALKGLANHTIDAHAAEPTEVAARIFRSPELGFKEQRTSALAREAFDRMGLSDRDWIPITGTRAEISCGT